MKIPDESEIHYISNKFNTFLFMVGIFVKVSRHNFVTVMFANLC